MNEAEIIKTARNLRALFALGFIITLFMSIGGGLIVEFGYTVPNVTKPIWEFGQYVLIAGSLNLALYFGLWWQVRSLRKQMGE